MTRKRILKTPKEKLLKSTGYLPQRWSIKSNDRYVNGIVFTFEKSTRTKSPTPNTGAQSFPPKGDSFLYIGMIGPNHGVDAS